MLVYDVKSLAVLAVNEAVVEMYGYSRDEFLNLTILDITPNADMPALLKSVARETGGIYRSGEWKHRKKDGALIDVEIITHDIEWAAQPARLVLAVDITQRKRAEELLRQSEESHRRLVELSPDAILVHRGGKIIFANAATLSLFAARIEELIGKQLIELAHPDDRELIQSRMRAVTVGGPPVRVERKYRTLNGRALEVELMISALVYEGAPATQVIFRDITERKKAERKLRQSEASLAAAQRMARLGCWEQDLSNPDDLNTQEVHWSDEQFRMFGIDPIQGPMLREVFVRAVHPDDRKRVHDELVASVREHRPMMHDFRIIRPDGSVRILYSEAYTIYDEKSERPLKVVGICQDITDRKRADERFYKAFNLSPEPMTIATASDGRYVDVNESFLRVTGFTREEVIGHTSLELNIWEQPEFRATFAELLEKHGSVHDLEFCSRTKSGGLWTVMASAEEIELAGERCIIAILKDVTEQKILEKQLRQAQKMEAIGQFSGGIAHDFNNLLGVIIGYSEVLETGLEAGTRLRRNAEEIKRAGQRAAALTRQILAFSRQQVLAPKILNLNTVVAETEKLLRRLLGEDIRLITSLAPDVGQVKADQGQIEQIIMNLAVNARDAMPEGGKLILATENQTLDGDYALHHAPTIPGEYVMLTVTDEGVGMDAETQSHIFEPFFTTKGVGKGTGLGLATVYGVVKQSGGYIWVYSEPGLGSTFKIYLPRVDQKVQRSKTYTVPNSALKGSETILLVEDEESLRTLTRTLLEQGGYTVLEASGGSQAAEIAETHKGPIHLLLTDMVMPEMNGRVIAKKLLALRPDLKVIYMSGYVGFGPSGELSSDDVFLPKPISRVELLRKINEVVHESKETATK
jgi:two-component system cell cycle sensor histidine kinase/response regulator CckA